MFAEDAGAKGILAWILLWIKTFVLYMYQFKHEIGSVISHEMRLLNSSSSGLLLDYVGCSCSGQA